MTSPATVRTQRELRMSGLAAVAWCNWLLQQREQAVRSVQCIRSDSQVSTVLSVLAGALPDRFSRGSLAAAADC